MNIRIMPNLMENPFYILSVQVKICFLQHPISMLADQRANLILSDKAKQLQSEADIYTLQCSCNRDDLYSLHKACYLNDRYISYVE